MAANSAYKKAKPYKPLFMPSPIGIVMYSFLAALIIILKQFGSLERYLQIPHGLQLTQTVFTGADHVLNKLLGSGRTAALVVGFFWALVGVAVYVFLWGLARFMNDLGAGYESRGFVWPKGADRNSQVMQVLKRGAFQVLACIGLLAVVCGPLAAVINGPVSVALLGENVVLRYALWFAAIWVLLHVAVVLLRLIVLKPRLFS